jgi:NADPH:quinone reductase-like Zn-dependent oxidoreductase
MRSVVITKHGPPSVLKVEERPDPAVGPGEIGVEVEAAGINFADLLARTGMYPDAPKPPSVVGYEVGGTVTEIGDGVTKFAVGDRVAAGTVFGGYSERISTPETAAVKLPDSLSFDQGAAIPVNYATAWAGMVMMGGLRGGDRVLVHGAGGGVGTACVQVARSIGAEIFGTASAAKHEAIRAQGVDHAIDYRSEDFETRIRELTDGEGVDVIMDATGPTNYRKDYRLLRDGGRLIMYGLSEVQTGTKRNLLAGASALARMPFATVPWWKSLAIMNQNKGIYGLNMLSWWKHEGLGRVLEPLEREIAEGRIDPVVDTSFSFDEAPAAHQRMHDHANVGKVVLVP